MNEDLRNILSNEDEKFLDMLSVSFRNEREKAIISESVVKKIAGTDFSFIPASAGYGKGLSRLFQYKFILPFMAVLGVVAVIVFGSQVGNQPGNTKSANQGKSVVKHDSAPPPAIDGHSPIEETAKQTEEQTNSSLKKEQATDKKGRKYAIAGLPSKEARQADLSAGPFSVSVNGMSISEIQSMVESMLGAQSFAFRHNTDSSSLLEIVTDEKTGLSKQNSPVRYSLTFIIKRSEPGKLYVYMFQREDTAPLGKNSKPGKIQSAYNKIKKDLEKRISQN